MVKGEELEWEVRDGKGDIAYSVGGAGVAH